MLDQTFFTSNNTEKNVYFYRAILDYFSDLLNDIYTDLTGIIIRKMIN